MATMVQNTPPAPPGAEQAHPPQASVGGNGRKGAGPEVPSRTLKECPLEPATTGIWVGIATITMMFAAFTSAVFVRQGAGPDWQHISLPPVLYLNTVLIVMSSLTLQAARKSIGSCFRGGVTKERMSISLGWLYATWALGLLFVAGQLWAWYSLKKQGLYLASTPNSSFFYLLTAVHGLHLLGGIVGMSRVIWKLDRPAPALRKSTLDATAHYWHFMGILWVYLLLLLRMKL